MKLPIELIGFGGSNELSLSDYNRNLSPPVTVGLMIEQAELGLDDAVNNQASLLAIESRLEFGGAHALDLDSQIDLDKELRELTKLDNSIATNTTFRLPSSSTIAAIRTGLNTELNLIEKGRISLFETLQGLRVLTKWVTAQCDALMESYYTYFDTLDQSLAEFKLLSKSFYSMPVNEHSKSRDTLMEIVVTIGIKLNDILSVNSAEHISDWKLYLDKLNGVLAGLEAKYLQANEKYLRSRAQLLKLIEDYELLFERSRRLNRSITNGDFIRSGNLIKVSKRLDGIYVNAVPTELEPCPEPQPLWLPPDVIITEPEPDCEPDTICNQNPTGAVKELLGGNGGYSGYIMYVQDDMIYAKGNTKYLMMGTWEVPVTANYEIELCSDDDFELYVDCELRQTGGFGLHNFLMSVEQGSRQIILRYENIPDNTPGYAGFRAYLNGVQVYETRASDYKGQANHVGEIENVPVGTKLSSGQHRISGYSGVIGAPPVITYTAPTYDSSGLEFKRVPNASDKLSTSLNELYGSNYPRDLEFKYWGKSEPDFFTKLNQLAVSAGLPDLVMGSKYNLGLEHVPEFNKQLYHFMSYVSNERPHILELEDWELAKNSLDIKGLTQLNKIETWLSYKWRTYTSIMSSEFLSIFNDELVAELGTRFNHLIHRLSFQESDGDSLTMAYALSSSDSTVRAVNVEPDTLGFNVVGHAPMVYGGGQFRVAKISWVSYQGRTIPTIDTEYSYALEHLGQSDDSLAYAKEPSPAQKILYAIVHEAAHTIDTYKGVKSGGTGKAKQFGFSLSRAWLDIAGWKLNGENYELDLKVIGYPNTNKAREQPPTVYGHHYPWEDFAESWAAYTLNPAMFRKFYPKRFSFMENYVLPFLNSLDTTWRANP